MATSSFTPTSNSGTYWNAPYQEYQEANIPLHFLVIGRIGGGRSATGNSILGKRAFPPSGGMATMTKEVGVAWAHHGRYEVKVVDGPGLKDADIRSTDNADGAVANMVQALLLCNGGLHAFLLVIKLGDKFTPEMKETISDLKKIFGEDYWRERGIIVVTGGDGFDDMMKNDGTPGLTFMDWVGKRKQDEVFKRLVRECDSRIVLFNNYAEDKGEIEDQRNWLFRHAEKLRQRGCYTSDHLQMYRNIRQKLTQDIHSPLLNEDFQRNISVFIEGLACFPQRPVVEDVLHFEMWVIALLSDVENASSEEELLPLKAALLQLHETAGKLKSAIINTDTGNINVLVQELQSPREDPKTVSKIPWKKIMICVLKAITIGAVAAGTIALIVLSNGTLLPTVMEALLPRLVDALPGMASALLFLGSIYLNRNMQKG